MYILEIVFKTCLFFILVNAVVAAYSTKDSCKDNDLLCLVNTGEVLFNKSNEPTLTLLELFNKESIVATECKSIVKETQAKWLRKASQERWELNQSIEKGYHHIFKKLGMISSFMPSKEFYKYIVILGSTIPNMETRITYFIYLLENGLQFKNVVFLTGLRKLNPIVDRVHAYKQTHKLETETDAARLLVQSLLIDSGLLTVDEIQIVSADKFSGNRPTTADTARVWLNSNPSEGSVLVISSQPFVGYQGFVMKNLLPIGFEVEAVGGSAPSLGTKSYLDNLARWIYELQKTRCLEK